LCGIYSNRVLETFFVNYNSWSVVLGLDAGPPQYKVGSLSTCDIHISTDILRFKLDLNPIFNGKNELL